VDSRPAVTIPHHVEEQRLRALGLSTELIHTALRPGLSRAGGRSALALASSAGTDIYHDTMEQLALALSGDGWRLAYVNRQPRLVHPNGMIAFTLASGTDVADPDLRRAPKTRRKGKATRASLAGPRVEIMPTLFNDPEDAGDQELIEVAEGAALWLLVHERSERGLKLEFSRPAQMTAAGIVNEWEQRIILPFLDLDGDLGVFAGPEDEGFDVPVEPLS